MQNNKIFQTKDYRRFKTLLGNRFVNIKNVEKIKNSIQKVGYILSPILVNEKYEVVDGQTRLMALQELKLPIDYIVQEGIGIDECIAMNINQSNWSTLNYIESYAERGYISYTYLNQLTKKYKSDFSLKVIVNALTGSADAHVKIIQKGELECSEEDYNRAIKTLDYLLLFKPIIDQLPGDPSHYYAAIVFCFNDPEVDNNNLLDKFKTYQAKLVPAVNILHAFDSIEAIYNTKTRVQKKVYIKTNYQKYLDNKYGWYMKRYGKNYENN